MRTSRLAVLSATLRKSTEAMGITADDSLRRHTTREVTFVALRVLLKIMRNPLVCNFRCGMIDPFASECHTKVQERPD